MHARILHDVTGDFESSGAYTSIESTSGHVTFTRPLRLPEGTGISITNGAPASQKCFVYGLLADQQDLYAAVPAQIENFELADASVGGTILTASPRPAVVQLLASSDLESWEPAAGVQVETTGTPSEREFEGSIREAADQTFYRATARAREREAVPTPTLVAVPLPIPFEADHE